MNGGCFGAICATNVPPARNRGNPMKKERTERNLPFPNMESRDRIRPAAKERGFRSEQAFILAACENELERGDNNEATTQLLDARIAATLSNLSKEVQSLFTLVHTQVALTNCLLQYVLTCVAEPAEEMLAAARARAKFRYAKILRLAGQEVATRNKATLEQVLEIPVSMFERTETHTACDCWPDGCRKDAFPFRVFTKAESEFAKTRKEEA